MGHAVAIGLQVQVFSSHETKEILKEMLSNLIRNSWIATKFMEPTKRMIRQRKLRSLWGDGSFVDFEASPYPTINFS